MYWLLFTFLVTSTYTLFAQNAYLQIAPTTGPSSTFSTSFPEGLLIAGNSAALYNVESVAITCYTERKYMLESLPLSIISCILPFHTGGLRFSSQVSGNPSFRQLEAGISYGKKLAEGLSLGVDFNYLTSRVTGEPNLHGVSTALGLLYELNESLIAGFEIKNPVSLGFKPVQEKLPVIYCAGIGFQSSEKIFFQAEIEKEESQQVIFRAALHYAFIPSFFIRLGIANVANQLVSGVGLKWKSGELILQAAYHPSLGLTPSLQLVFSLKKAAKQ